MSDSLHVVFGTGPLGRAVAADLTARGEPVRVVNRSGRAAAGLEEIETVAGDLTDPDAAAAAADGATVIYHCAVTPYTDWPATLPALMAGAISAAERTGARLVYGDNLYAYAPTDGPITEDTPEAPTTRKGRVRKQVADQLRAAHDAGRIQATIGRGSDFYGPGVHTSAVGDEVFGRLADGKAPRLLGDPDRRHSFTYVPDFGRALAVLGRRSEALGATWHVPTAAAGMSRAFADLAAKAMDRPAGASATPSWLVKAFGMVSPMMRELSEMLYEWEHDFVTDDARFLAAFGDDFGRATPLAVGVQATADWFQSARREP